MDPTTAESVTGGAQWRGGFVMPLFVGTWVRSYDVPSLLIYVFVITVGLGNISVIITFLRCPQLRKPFNILVLGMAFADVIRSGITAPMEVVMLANRLVPPGGKSWCYAMVTMRTFSFNSTLILLVCVSIVRLFYGVMTFPPQLTNRKSSAIVGLTYILASAMTLLAVTDRSATLKTCLGVVSVRKEDEDPYFWKIHLGICCLGFGVMTLCYGGLGLALRCRRKKLEAAQNGGGKPKKASKSEIMTLRVSVYVTGCFLLCYLIPFLPVLNAIRRTVPLLWAFHHAALFNSFSYLQCCANPVIYILTCQVYRQSTWALLPKSCRGFLRRLCCKRGWTETSVVPISVTSRSLQLNDATRGH